MGAFSGKFMGDPGRYTFQQALSRIAVALENAQANKNTPVDEIQIDVTIRSSGISETINVPTDSVREVIEILKLNGE